MTSFLLSAAFLLLALSAVVTAAATAAFLLSPSRLRTMQEEGFHGADTLVRLRAEPGRVHSGVRILNSILHAGVIGLSVMAVVPLWGPAGQAGALVGALVVVVLLADILPRTMAARHPVRLALLSAPFLMGVTRWVHLVTAPVARLEDALVGSGEGDVTTEERTLREIQEIGAKDGVLGEEENLLVERAFRLDELTAWDAMTPRVDIFAWPEDRTLEEIIPELDSVPYSRVPVYRGSVDEVTGILYVREVYQAYVEGAGNRTLGSLAREPFFVPGSLSLARLLQEFQSKRIHMGIVADEFGGTDGLITLEDVLEELVGEIVDETDVDEEDMVRVSGDEMVADGGVDIREINSAFHVSLPLVEHRSLNGFILEELGYVPRPGEILDRGGLRIEILEATETQVLKARLTRQPEAADSPKGED
ncbi:MAG: hemolysin family protein [Gemmatimonadota bacterium]